MSQDIYRMPGQQIQKSIIYEVPRGQNTEHSRFNQHIPNNKKYRAQEQLNRPKNVGEQFLCLNCHSYIRVAQVDSHSIEHLRML